MPISTSVKNILGNNGKATVTLANKEGTASKERVALIGVSLILVYIFLELLYESRSAKISARRERGREATDADLVSRSAFLLS